MAKRPAEYYFKVPTLEKTAYLAWKEIRENLGLDSKATTELLFKLGYYLYFNEVFLPAEERKRVAEIVKPFYELKASNDALTRS